MRKVSMEASKVWLRWVREGSAYTITKSRRKAVRRARLKVVAILTDYMRMYFEIKKYPDDEKGALFLAFGDYLKNYIECKHVDTFCESVWNDDKDCIAPILQRYFVHASDIYTALNSYHIEVINNGRWSADCLETLRRSVKRINNPNPGMIARAIFREIETELIREAKKHE